MIPRDHPVHSATRWRDQLLIDLPGHLLRWFACDCAERACSIAAVHDNLLVYAMQLCRRHALGEFGDKVLREMWLKIPIYNGNGRCAQRAVRNSLFPGSLSAAIETAHAAWGAIMEATHSDLQKDQATCPERRWQLTRLLYLVEVWTTCGERSPQLLYDGLCPISWSDFCDQHDCGEPALA